MSVTNKDFDNDGQIQKNDEEESVRTPSHPQRTTPAEATMWHILHGPKLTHLMFRRQQVVNGFTISFYCPEMKLGIEIVGIWHNYRAEYDQERKRILAGSGITVLQFSAEQLQAQPLVVHDAIVASIDAE